MANSALQRVIPADLGTRLDAWIAHVAPRVGVGLLISGPLLVGAVLGYVIIGLVFGDEPAAGSGPPQPPAEWLDDTEPAQNRRSSGFGKTL